MLETILAISGKPGLYRLVSRGNRSLIIETLDAQKKRMPAFAADKVISLADIAMYTDEKEVPLREVLNNIKKLVQWYNILIENNLTDFDEALKETDGDNIDDRKYGVQIS